MSLNFDVAVLHFSVRGHRNRQLELKSRLPIGALSPTTIHYLIRDVV